MSDPSRPSRPAIVLLLMGSAWLLAAAVAILATGTAVPSFAEVLRPAADLVVRLVPPLALVLAAIVLVRAAGPRDAAALAELEERTRAAQVAGAAVRDGLLDIDATLASVASRLDAVRTASADAGERLTAIGRTAEATATGLVEATARCAAVTREFAGLLPAAQGDADRLAATLAATGGETVRQLHDVEVLLAGVFTRQDEVAHHAQAMAHATTAAGAAIDDRRIALEAAVDTALTRTGHAVDEVRRDVDAQTATMLAGIAAAQAGLAAHGGPAADLAARIDALFATSAAFGAQLAEHDARSSALVHAIERSFAVLDKRLAHAAAMGSATLDSFQARMTAVRDAADAIHPRLDAARATLAEIEAATGQLQPAAADAAALGSAIDAVAGPLTAVTAGLAAARGDVVALEDAAHGTALAAASQLIEVLGRVREIGDGAAGRLRAALVEVVAEAETALAEAGRRTAASAFADPVRHEIAGLEGAAELAGAAAQATADRIAARLLGLTAAVATVERRLEEISPGDRPRARH